MNWIFPAHFAARNLRQPLPRPARAAFGRHAKGLETDARPPWLFQVGHEP